MDEWTRSPSPRPSPAGRGGNSGRVWAKGRVWLGEGGRRGSLSQRERAAVREKGDGSMTPRQGNSHHATLGWRAESRWDSEALRGLLIRISSGEIVGGRLLLTQAQSRALTFEAAHPAQHTGRSNGCDCSPEQEARTDEGQDKGRNFSRRAMPFWGTERYAQ